MKYSNYEHNDDPFFRGGRRDYSDGKYVNDKTIFGSRTNSQPQSRVQSLYERTEELARQKREDGQRKLDVAKEQIRRERSGQSGAQTSSQRGTIKSIDILSNLGNTTTIGVERSGSQHYISLEGFINPQLKGLEVDINISSSADGRVTQYSIVPVEKALRKLRVSYP
jgi:hypothetical protein